MTPTLPFASCCSSQVEGLQELDGGIDAFDVLVLQAQGFALVRADGEQNGSVAFGEQFVDIEVTAERLAAVAG